jgi:acyl-CoA thioester hydrolase
MKEHQIQIRVRYSETDQMSVVYHGNYMPYFEMGRVEWLRNKGISYKSLEENGIALPIVSMTINYKKPARYDDLLTVVTTIKEIPSTRIYFQYEIYNQKNELLNKGDTTLVFVEIVSGKPCKPPTDFLTTIEKFFIP